MIDPAQRQGFRWGSGYECAVDHRNKGKSAPEIRRNHVEIDRGQCRTVHRAETVQVGSLCASERQLITPLQTWSRLETLLEPPQR